MIYSRTPRAFSERERNLAGSVATQLALFIERRRAERERLEAMLAAEALAKRLQIITDAVPVLIAYVDRQERHRFASKAFENWFGISPEQMLGKSVRELVGDAAYEAIRLHVDESPVRGRDHFRHPWRRSARLQPRWLRATYVPQRNPNGEVDGFVALVLDISAQKQADAAQEALVSNLERTVAFSRALRRNSRARSAKSAVRHPHRGRSSWVSGPPRPATCKTSHTDHRQRGTDVADDRRNSSTSRGRASAVAYRCRPPGSTW